MPGEFFISGFVAGEGDARPSVLEIRGGELRYLARVELNRFEFGLQDRSQGKDSQAARDIENALARAGRLSHPRAKQRAQSYNPREGQEHCPHCWVFIGRKEALQFTPVEGEEAEQAACRACGNQYQISKA